MGFWSKFVKFFTPPPVEKPKVSKAKVSKAKVIKEATVKLDKFVDAPVVKGEPKRARNKKGRFIADDKSTPDINEAWVGGKAPKKKAKATKKVSKKK